VFVDVTETRRLEALRREFVANVSHELRTPVTTIRSAAETLHLTLETDLGMAAKFTDIIDRNATRLQTLVEDLLDLSRIESRKYSLSLVPVRLGEFFQNIARLQEELAQKRRVTVKIEVPDGLPPVRADRNALERVLTNLVDNAIKYAGEGRQVVLRAEPSAGQLLVSVIDNGPGIEERHLSRIFERFYRVDAGRSRDVGGTGLGLSIVKHLVESMGGSVGVESQVGRGTQFLVRLPLAVTPSTS
jgi:two-component system, OmpR family, phosphate regulon sensor histidine kinase PhoR